MRVLSFSSFIFALTALLQGAEPPAILISGTELVKDLQSFDLIDVRDAKAYEEGHIGLAVRLDMAAVKEATGKGSLENDSYWNTQIGGLGIDGKQPIVVYGAPLPEVARVWWLLKYLGCSDVRILDGGVASYQSAGGMTSTALAKRAAKEFKPMYQKDRIITADELLKEGVQAKTCQIVDNRTVGEFTGTEVRGPRGGHIPNAKNSDWQKYVDKDGKFLPRDELAKLLKDAGIDVEQPAVTHCQSGGRSSVGAFVIELVGGKPARNYYRSWGEWAGRSDLPVESK